MQAQSMQAILIIPYDISPINLFVTFVLAGLLPGFYAEN